MKSIRFFPLLLAFFLLLLALPAPQAFAQTGGLQVVIDPAEARDDGAQWRRAGQTAWRNSGDTETNIPAGDVIVEFRPVVGWKTPDSRTVSITAEQTTTLRVEYTSTQRYIQVFIGPVQARRAGAQWRVVGDDEWLNSGLKKKVAANARFEVEFRKIRGWREPETVEVPAGESTEAQPTTFTVFYTSEQYGRLQVNIRPESAINLGAAWRRAGTQRWIAGGSTELELPEGTYTIEFKPIAPLGAAPMTRAVRILGGEQTEVSGLYRVPQGLRVLIEPAGARQAGAQWRRVGTQPWRNSGFIEPLPLGTRAVEFKPVPNWRTPQERQVVIRGNNLTHEDALYTIPQGLRVLIEPAQARLAGAQWRRVGTQVWRNNGHMERLPAGTYQIEFKRIANWNEPANRRIAVRANRMASVQGQYTIPQGLRVVIGPPQASEDGAQWRRQGMQSWLDSGHMLRLSHGSHVVEFKGINNWIKPRSRTERVEWNRLQTIHAWYRIPQGLRVLVEPAGARQAGAQWRRVGTQVWRSHGFMERLPAGTFQVEFKEIENWTKPRNRLVLIQGNRLTTTSATYTRR